MATLLTDAALPRSTALASGCVIRISKLLDCVESARTSGGLEGDLCRRDKWSGLSGTGVPDLKLFKKARKAFCSATSMNNAHECVPALAWAYMYGRNDVNVNAS